MDHSHFLLGSFLIGVLSKYQPDGQQADHQFHGNQYTGGIPEKDWLAGEQEWEQRGEAAWRNRLAGALSRWAGTDITGERHSFEDRAVLERGIRQADPVGVSLYRGLRGSDVQAKTLQEFRPGEVVSLGPSSFTSSREVADHFERGGVPAHTPLIAQSTGKHRLMTDEEAAQYRRDYAATRPYGVRLQVRPGAKAINLNQITRTENAYEHEFLTGGQFHVDQVEHDPATGRVTVQLTHVSPPDSMLNKWTHAGDVLGGEDAHLARKWSASFAHHGGGKFAQGVRDLQAGKRVATQDAHDFLNALHRNAQSQAGIIHRGLRLTPDQAAGMTPGGKLHLDVSSWSKSQRVAHTFATSFAARDQEGDTYLLHAEPDTKGWELPHTGTPDTTVKEVVSGGTFRVTGTKPGRVDGRKVTHVYVHQTHFGPKKAVSKIALLKNFSTETLRDWVERDDWETQPDWLVQGIALQLHQDLRLEKFLREVTLEKWIPQAKWREGQEIWEQRGEAAWEADAARRRAEHVAVNEGVWNAEGEWLGHGFGHHVGEDFHPGDNVYVWAKGKLHHGVVREPNPNRPGTVAVKPDTSPVMYRRPEVVAHRRAVETVSPVAHTARALHARNKAVRAAHMAAADLVTQHAKNHTDPRLAGLLDDPVPEGSAVYDWIENQPWPEHVKSLAHEEAERQLAGKATPFTRTEWQSWANYQAQVLPAQTPSEREALSQIPPLGASPDNFRKLGDLSGGLVDPKNISPHVGGVLHTYLIKANLKTGESVLVKGVSNKRLSIPEFLVAKVAEAINAPVGDVELTHFHLPNTDLKHQITKVWIEGRVNGDVSWTVREHAISSLGGKRLALLDILTGLRDRENPGNWLVQPTGSPAGIDHGLARFMGWTTSPFWSRWRSTLLGTVALMDSIIPALEALGPVFEKYDAYQAWKNMMEVAGAIEMDRTPRHMNFPEAFARDWK